MYTLQLEESMPMLVLIAQEAARRKLVLSVRTIAVLKRGVCTFVEKTRIAQDGKAHFALVVNSEDDVSDMPAGKENTTECITPAAIAAESSGACTYI